jgi:hypothetical protein
MGTRSIFQRKPLRRLRVQLLLRQQLHQSTEIFLEPIRMLLLDRGDVEPHGGSAERGCLQQPQKGKAAHCYQFARPMIGYRRQNPVAKQLPAQSQNAKRAPKVAPPHGIEHHVNPIARGLPNDRDKILALVVDWLASQRADQSMLPTVCDGFINFGGWGAAESDRDAASDSPAPAGFCAGKLGPIAFIFLITRFQIIPEERAMSLKFGPEYNHYRSQVPRWL